MTKENLLLFCGIVLCGLLCVFLGVERSVERPAMTDRLVGEWLSRESELWMQPEGSDSRTEYTKCNHFVVMTFDEEGRGSLMEAFQREADSITWSYDGETNTLIYRYINKLDDEDILCTLDWVDDNTFILTARRETPYVSRYIFQRVTSPRCPVVLP